MLQAALSWEAIVSGSALRASGGPAAAWGSGTWHRSLAAYLQDVYYTYMIDVNYLSIYESYDEFELFKKASKHEGRRKHFHASSI